MLGTKVSEEDSTWYLFLVAAVCKGTQSQNIVEFKTFIRAPLSPSLCTKADNPSMNNSGRPLEPILGKCSIKSRYNCPELETVNTMWLEFISVFKCYNSFGSLAKHFRQNNKLHSQSLVLLYRGWNYKDLTYFSFYPSKSSNVSTLQRMSSSSVRSWRGQS